MSKPAPEFYDLSERLLNSGRSYWGNLGYWKSAIDYSSACEALAHQLAEAVSLNENSRIFDAGFGCGDQLLLWLNHYNAHSIAGINYSKSQTALAKVRLEKMRLEKEDSFRFIIQGDVADLNKSIIFETQAINTVLALDCAYHFPSRKHFLADSFNLLARSDKTKSENQSRPVIGLTDLVLASADLSWGKRLLLNAMLKLSKIPKENTVTLEEYENQLQEAGFSNITSKDISKYVLPSFGRALYGLSLNSRFLNNQSIKALMERRRNEPHEQLAASSIESLYRYEIKNTRALWLKYKVTAVFLAWAYKRGVLRYMVICGVKA